MIKRRKRVVPAPHGSAACGYDVAGNAIDSAESDEEILRGSKNQDGSINLGTRARPGSSRGMLPNPTSRTSHQPQQVPSSAGLIAYASASQIHNYQPSDGTSMIAENKLPPLNSYPVANRGSSLSPNAFLSLSRKRSFSEAESSGPEITEPKRLSFIKSILNPSRDAHGHVADPPYSASTSQSQFHPASDSSYDIHCQTELSKIPPPRDSDYARNPINEEARTKAERRLALKKETESMRELLARKERELAEL